MTIDVLLVDDHRVFLETLSAALSTNKDFKVVGAVGTAGEGRAEAEALKPDVALLDVALPDFDGIELAKQLRAITPDTRVIMLTGSTDPALFPKAMSAGACGYLLKESGLAQVTDAIRRAHAGEVVVPEGSVLRLTKAVSAESGLGSKLTDRELQVLSLLAGGSDAKAIARSLGITWNTARSYIKNILMSLDAHSQLEAVAVATRLGIISMDRDEVQ